MEIRTLIILAIVIVLAVVAYFLVFSHIGNVKKTTTIGGTVNGTTSITVPPYITTYNAISGKFSKNITNITGENIKTEYSGPATEGGISCSGISRAYTLNYRDVLHATSNVTFYFYIYSLGCNFTITKISIDNSGFNIINLQPPLPYLLPADSQIQESVTATTPAYNFTGPLSITVYAK